MQIFQRFECYQKKKSNRQFIEIMKVASRLGGNNYKIEAVMLFLPLAFSRNSQNREPTCQKGYCHVADGVAQLNSEGKKNQQSGIA